MQSRRLRSLVRAGTCRTAGSSFRAIPGPNSLARTTKAGMRAHPFQIRIESIQKRSECSVEIVRVSEIVQFSPATPSGSSLFATGRCKMGITRL